MENELKRVAATQLLRRAFHGRAEAALPYGVGALFYRFGIAHPRENAPSLPPQIMAALNGAWQNDARVPASLELYVAGCDGDPPVRVPVRELLFCASEEIRTAVTLFLQREKSLYSISSKRLLQEVVSDVPATDPDRWVPAAVRLSAAMENDFYCNVACVRSAVSAVDLQTACDALSRALSPSLVTLLQHDDDNYMYVVDAATRSSQMDLLSQSRDSAHEFLTRSYAAIGHLPLSREVDHTAVARKAFGERPCGWDADALAAWVGELPSPGRLMHATLLMLDACSNGSQKTKAWLVESLISLLRVPKVTGLTSRLPTIVTLEAELERHFVRLIEAQVPHVDVRRAATVAFWAARRVADAISLAPSAGEYTTELLVAVGDTIAARSATDGWRIARPIASASTIRCLVHCCPLPWIAVLLHRSVGAYAELHAAIASEDREVISGRLQAYYLGSWPVLRPVDGERIWACDESLAPAYHSWIDVQVDPASRREQHDFVGLLEPADALHAAPLKLIDWGDDARPAGPVLSGVFARQLVYCSPKLDASTLGQTYSMSWCERVILSSHSGLLDAVADGLFEYLVRSPREQQLVVLESIASLYRKHAADAGFGGRFLEVLVVGSAVTRAVDPLRLLVDDRHVGNAELSEMCKRVENLVSNTSPLAQARLRDILSILAR